MTHTKLISAAVAGLVAAALSTAALAAPGLGKPKGLTGVWSGKTHQEIQPLAEGGDNVDWSQRITIRAFDGRLSSITASLRYACPSPTNPMAGDVRLLLSWNVLKKEGPALGKTGGFALYVTHMKDPFSGKDVPLYAPVRISGTLGPHGATGTFTLSKGGCSGRGDWKANRRF
jgi:hypothetical protein